MSAWSPCKRRKFTRRLRAIGFDGPFSGSRHQFMTFEQYRFAIPSNSEYSIPQLRLLLREVEGIVGRKITVDEWNEL